MTTYTITAELLQELISNCMASIAEEGISDARRVYRTELHHRANLAMRNMKPNTQKPCAWMNTAGKSTLLTTREPHEDYGTVVENWFPLYTHPAPQQPAEVVELQAKLSAAEARERQTRATLHKFMANQQQPLTVQEVEQILAQHNYELHGDRARYIVRMTEQAHGVKPCQ